MIANIFLIHCSTQSFEFLGFQFQQGPPFVFNISIQFIDLSVFDSSFSVFVLIIN